MDNDSPDKAADTASGQYHAWLFEAKGIQRWLFANGRLRDVIGASDLAAHIAASDGDDLIGLVIGECAARRQGGLALVDALPASGGGAALSFSRRAGGAFCLHAMQRDILVNVREAFLLRFLLALPGLEYEDSLGSGPNELAARDAAYAARSGVRGNAAASVLPLGRPVFAFTPRTGLPRVGSRHYGADEDRHEEALDAILAPQRAWADTLQRRFAELRRQGADHQPQPGNRDHFMIDGAAMRFHSNTKAEGVFAYPRNLADDEPDKDSNPLFPWRKDSSDRRIGLIHADISGLGQIFQNAEVANAKAARDLGDSIERAILAAIGTAADELLLPAAVSSENWEAVVPARPIVVGGDDITVLVRADLALPFAARLLTALEETTKDIEGGLSACAGVAIARAGHPFLTLNHLAESLCSFAKRRAKSASLQQGEIWPSLLAFHVQTQTAEEDYGEDIYPHLCPHGGLPVTANPYLAGPARDGMESPRWDDLCQLARGLDAVSGAYTTMRTIKGELALGGAARRGMVDGLWRRFWQRQDRSESQVKALDALGAQISTLADIPKEQVEGSVPQLGMLFDALELIDLGVPLDESDPAAAEAQQAEAA